MVYAMTEENALENSSLLHGISHNCIKDILLFLSAVRKEYEKGENILWEGDTICDVGILLSGSAQSTKTDVTGKQVIVTMLKPGSYIGVLLAASHHRKSPVSVIALEKLAVLFIPIQNIVVRNNCPCHSQLLGNLLDGIAEKALVLHDRNNCLIKPTIRSKVLTFLAGESRRFKSNSFTISMGRDAMAEYLNVDRSALSRELSRMKRDGLIDYKKSWFELRHSVP